MIRYIKQMLLCLIPGENGCGVLQRIRGLIWGCIYGESHWQGFKIASNLKCFNSMEKKGPECFSAFCVVRFYLGFHNWVKIKNFFKSTWQPLIGTFQIDPDMCWKMWIYFQFSHTYLEFFVALTFAGNFSTILDLSVFVPLATCPHKGAVQFHHKVYLSCSLTWLSAGFFI